MAIMNGLVLEDGHAELLVFLARSGCRLRELPIHVEPRRQGVSMYRFSKLLFYPLKTSFLLLLALLTRRLVEGGSAHDTSYNASPLAVSTHLAPG